MGLKNTNIPVELAFEQLLIKHGIVYSCPDQEKGLPGQTKLDFFLPEFQLTVEVKTYSTPRLHDQITRSGKEEEGLIVLVGIKAVHAFDRLLESLLKKAKNKATHF